MQMQRHGVVRSARVLGFIAVLCSSLATSAAFAQSAAHSVPEKFDLPGSPFGVQASPDGRWAFATLSGASNGLAVFRRDQHGTQLSHVVPLTASAWGLTITHDAKYLLVTVQPGGLAVIDVRKAIANAADAVLGVVFTGENAGAIEVALSKDERFAFVTNENIASVSVVDLHAALASNFSADAVVGDIPVETLPVGVVVSPSGRYAYVTSEEALPGSAGYDPTLCQIPAGAGTRPGAQGTLTVIDVKKAQVDPENSIVSRVYAGCVPVRVQLSSAGTVAWITARASNAVLAFDTTRLLFDPTRALISTTPVGIAPVGLKLFAGGLLLAVANSNRFGDQDGSVSIVDTTRALAGRPGAVRDTIAVGIFPREWSLSPLGDKLYLTEFRSSRLSIFDTGELVRDILTGRATP